MYNQISLWTGIKELCLFDVHNFPMLHVHCCTFGCIAEMRYTIYGKTFEGKTFAVTQKHLSLEKICGLAISAIIYKE